MAKQYTIDLPITQTRELRYTRQERLDFEKRFRDRGMSGMKAIIGELVLPTVPDPDKPGQRLVTVGGDLEAQEYLIYLGLRHLGSAITEKRVSEWLDLAVREEGPERQMVAFVAPAVAAVFASGVLGFVYEYKVEKDEEAAPATEGKAEATA
jgi:hypothetical protein